MKKLILIFVIAFGMSAITVSCKENKHENNEATESHAAEKAEMAMNEVFQCPMDCEEGKTYDEAGACPVCAMDLKKMEGTHKHEDGEVHEDHEKEHEEEGEHHENDNDENH